MKSRVLPFFLCFSAALPVFSQNFYEGFSQKERFESASAKGAAFALGGTVFCDAALFCFNRFVTKAEYAQVSADDIRKNLRSPLVWDQDTFQVNQLGHPYQGSFYFASARSCGFPFELSAIYAATGSVLWEYFAENERPSLNDIICTVFGGAALGEMLHRIYLEVAPRFLPAACLISPMDAVFGAALKSGLKERGKIVKASAAFGIGVGNSLVRMEKIRKSDKNVLHANVNAGFDVSYGDAFFAPAYLPYSAFDLSVDLAGSTDFFEVSILSEGVLSRFATFFGAKSKTFLGAAMQFDVLWSNIFAHCDNGLGILAKTRSEFKNGFSADFSASASAVLLGASEYWRLYSGEIRHPDDGIERRNYDFGAGGTAKISLEVSQKKFGTLRARLLSAFMKSIPKAIPPCGSDGTSLSNFLTISYERDLKAGFSLGIEYFGQLKAAWNKSDANVLNACGNIKIFSRFSMTS